MNVSTTFRQSLRASAAFELMTVVGISGLMSSALLPMLGSSVEIERFRSAMFQDKQDAYLFNMEAASLGLPGPALSRSVARPTFTLPSP